MGGITPTPGIEPGFPARQASVIAIRPRGHTEIKLSILLLNLATLSLTIKAYYRSMQKSMIVKNQSKTQELKSLKMP